MDDKSRTESSANRIFVIGDIHGCKDELRVILDHLNKREHLDRNDLVVFLGDYIDRGHETKGVVQLLVEFKNQHPNTRFLRGNHEEMFSDFLMGGHKLGFSFLRNGGVETVQSYGVDVDDYSVDIDLVVDALPMEHAEFFENLEPIIQLDSFICVHAGLNPNRALESQQESEICWIRDEFINYPHDFGKTVVFGHTPWREVFVELPYKIGVDTGLVFGNKLTCLELREGLVIQTSRKSRKVSTSKVKLKL